MDRCKKCNAVVNPRWEKCFSCGLPFNLNKPKEPTIIKDQVSKMKLEEFTKRNLAIKIYSEILEDEIWLVSSKEIRDKVTCEGLSTYLPHEIEHIIKIKPEREELKKINLIKEMFPKGEIIWN